MARRAVAQENGFDRQTVAAAHQVLAGGNGKGRLARLLPFLGPAFIASVAYIDPGNVATNVQAGAQYGYLLLWVIMASNLAAMVIQALSAKLGIATGRNLAELSRREFPRWVVLLMWLVMELVAMATDLAEFLGAAIGFNLLLGIPLWLAGIFTAIATFVILELERYGFRPLEAVIAVLVGIVAASYLIETVLDRPDWIQVTLHAVLPRFSGSESVLLATGILGATVMPHAIFLHSALTQKRIEVDSEEEMVKLFHYEIVDVILAMFLAGLVNAAMLVMAAATFHQQGLHDVGTIEEAYRTLQPLLGRAASTVFAVALLAAGLSSSTVGTMAGQVIMQGFLHRHIPVWLRRLVTMVPSLLVIGAGLDPTRSLVISQVVLSFGLPFAIVPLVLFTRQKRIMGSLVNHPLTTLLLSLIAVLVIALNIYLLFATFRAT